MGHALQLVLRQGGLSQAPYPALGSLFGAEGLRRFGRGAGVGHVPRPKAPTGAVLARSAGDRSSHAGTMARVVVGQLRAEFILAAGSRSLHAAAVPHDDALVLMPEF